MNSNQNSKMFHNVSYCCSNNPTTTNSWYINYFYSTLMKGNIKGAMFFCSLRLSLSLVIIIMGERCSKYTVNITKTRIFMIHLHLQFHFHFASFGVKVRILISYNDIVFRSNFQYMFNPT